MVDVTAGCTTLHAIARCVIEIPASVAGPLAVLALVWLTNLYNFMDGIDGLAAGEALLVGAFGSGLLAAAGHPGLAGLALALSGASAGFLVWNWWPARNVFDKKSAWHNERGQARYNILYGDLHVDYLRTPKEMSDWSKTSSKTPNPSYLWW